MLTEPATATNVLIYLDTEVIGQAQSFELSIRDPTVQTGQGTDSIYTGNGSILCTITITRGMLNADAWDFTTNTFKPGALRINLVLDSAVSNDLPNEAGFSLDQVNNPTLLEADLGRKTGHKVVLNRLVVNWIVPQPA